MWRRSSLSFSSKLLNFQKSPNYPSSSSAFAAQNDVARSLFLARSLSLSYDRSSVSSSSSSSQESVKLGFQRSDGIRTLSSSSAAIDFSSVASSKARETLDLARHYGRCYWELSKARLRNERTNCEFSIYPDANSLILKLQSCDSPSSLSHGKKLHLIFLKMGLLESSVAIGNRLLLMYVRCGGLRDARVLFDGMPERNSFSWNTLVEGYLKSGDLGKSIEFFDMMPEKNDFSWNTVVSGFAKLGFVDVARKLFDEMPRKTVVACTSMIHGYARKGRQKDALRLFKRLSSSSVDSVYVDKFVFATVIGVCTDLVALGCGKQIHARIVVDKVEVDPTLASSLVNFYGKCGDLDSANHVFNARKEPDEYCLSALIISLANFGRMEDAKRVFETRNKRSVELWSSMISAYVSNNNGIGALGIFNDMRSDGVREDSSTLVGVLSSCCILGVVLLVKQFHAHVCKIGMMVNVIVASALLDAYFKCGGLDEACILFHEVKVFDTIMLNSMITVYLNCGRIDEAKKIFKSMPARSLISWNSMIVGLCQIGFPIEALDLFQDMNKEGLKMDEFNLASAISACASISSFQLGEQIFARLIVVGLENDEIISNSLIDLYCKCGLVANGRKVFDRMMKLERVPWNTMLTGYATNGHGHEALTLFNEMQWSGVKPDGITFTGVLSACGHCGLVDEGRRWFRTMQSDYQIVPRIEHYSCLIDLLSRAGCLEEAMTVIEQMPLKPDANMLSSVLRGCMVDGNKSLGKVVANKIIELDCKNSGAYTQLSNLLASYGEWEISAEVREVMSHKGIQKIPGRSWSDC